MEEQFSYFFSYNFTDKTGPGTGNSQIIRNIKITSYKDILEVIEQLKEYYNFDSVTIINYILMES